VQRRQKSLFSGCIKICVWLVKDEQAGVSIKTPCETDALSLAAGKSVPVIAYVCVVSIGQVLDKLVATS
jgi:hypothetical protein